MSASSPRLALLAQACSVWDKPCSRCSGAAHAPASWQRIMQPRDWTSPGPATLEASAGAWRWLQHWHQARDTDTRGVRLHEAGLCSLLRVGDVLVHLPTVQHSLVVSPTRWAALIWPLELVGGADQTLLRLDVSSASPLEWCHLHAANLKNFAMQPAAWRLGQHCGQSVESSLSLQLLLVPTGWRRKHVWTGQKPGVKGWGTRLWHHGQSL
jgi:hypothetical protein